MSHDSEFPPLPDDVAEVFSQAALVAYSELFQLEAFVVNALDSPSTGSDDTVQASIQLRRPSPGEFLLSLGEELARRLAERYLPAGTELTAELVGDAVGELANVMAGQAKTALKGTPYHFTLSTPRIAWGAAAAQESAGAQENAEAKECEKGQLNTPAFCALVECEFGQARVRVWLSACPGA